MSWKIVEVNGKKYVELDDKSNPIRVLADGKESGIAEDALASANREAAERKEAIKKLESQLEPFKSIENPAEWLQNANKALETVSALPDKDKAVEERIRAQVEAATKPLNERIATAIKENETLKAQYQNEAVGNSFARSAFVREKMVDPAMAADLFKGRFVMRDGKVVALGENGEPIYGENGVASFDEAMAKFVEASPYKTSLLKGSDKSGSGANPGSGGGGGTGKAKSLADCKTDAEKLAYLKEKAGAA